MLVAEERTSTCAFVEQPGRCIDLETKWRFCAVVHRPHSSINVCRNVIILIRMCLFQWLPERCTEREIHSMFSGLTGCFDGLFLCVSAGVDLWSRFLNGF